MTAVVDPRLNGGNAMLRDEVFSAVVAIGLGAVVSVVLFVPYVAWLYRRRGHVSAAALATGIAAAVYGWAIWTYTLLPLPQGPIEVCAGVNLSPGTFVDEVRGVLDRGGSLLTDPAMLQFAFNVLLFVPLGFFVRLLVGRGFLVATAVGLLVSLAIEFTQLTGVWGLYECAYRVFDVLDLITNTLGALVGSLLALLLPGTWLLHRAKPDAGLPRPVTRARRIVVMVSDALTIFLLQASVAVVLRVIIAALVGTPTMLEQAEILDAIATWVPLGLMFVLIMASGRSVGDLAVRLVYVGGRQPEPVARLMRFVGGVGGVSLASYVPIVGPLLSLALFVAAVVMAFTTRNGRGLPGVLAGRELADSRGQSEQTGAVAADARTGA